MQNCFILACALVGFFLVLGCQALPPNTIQKLVDADPRMTQELGELEQLGEKTIRLVQANISRECSNALMYLVNNESRALLAYIDATGKIPSGILEGDFLWLGSYSACNNIPSAHYCMANVLLYKISLFKDATKITVQQYLGF
ncbi:hypothetical protein AC249_AIPGENE16410 [Exaiptasia diaphana]|nr:hypothetical protein AC249_AIPGENE16410 [Exaiptasia diaphana]